MSRSLTDVFTASKRVVAEARGEETDEENQPLLLLRDAKVLVVLRAGVGERLLLLCGGGVLGGVDDELARLRGAAHGGLVLLM